MNKKKFTKRKKGQVFLCHHQNKFRKGILENKLNMTVLGFFFQSTKKINFFARKLHKMFHSAILFNCRPLEKLIHCFFVQLLLLKSPSVVMYHSRMKMSFSALSTWTFECMNMQHQFMMSHQWSKVWPFLTPVIASFSR